MQTGRRGRDLEIAGLLRAEIHDQTRPLTTTIGHPLRRQTGADATRMAAATRMGIAHISHPRARVDRREVITRMLPRITPVMVAAAALMRHRRVLIRHRAAVILLRHGPIRRRLLIQRRAVAILRRRGRILHRPLRRVLTQLLAEVMAAEVGVAEAAAADRMVAVEAPRMEAEVAPEVAADRTDIKESNNSSSPSQSGAGFFSLRRLVRPALQLLAAAGVYVDVADRAFPDWTSGKCLMERDSI
jgi:hypothetical protein